MFLHTKTSKLNHVERLKKLHLFADTHGVVRYEIIKKYVESNNLCSADAIIVLGDFGLVWEEPMNSELLNFYNGLPCEVLFVDGNHENFDYMQMFPRDFKFGSEITKISDNIAHLRRGNVYMLGFFKFFTFGGAFSIKQDTNSSPVMVWKQELPTEEEYEHALCTLQKYKYKVDYVLTHQGPRFILDKINYKYSKNEYSFLDFLNLLSDKIQFKTWLFGHVHQDINIDNYKSIYKEHEVINLD
jgi:predicted phosphodiesterase